MSTNNPATEILAALGIPNGPAEYVPSTQNRVPMQEWGADHWSTLGYLEVRIVDHRGKIAHDHMRCHSHHPKMLVAKRRGNLFGQGAGDRYPTRLKGGVEREHHDDYDCIDDMIAEGLVEVDMPEAPGGVLITGLVEQEMMTRATYRLTERGQRIAAQLRAHKGNGGRWSDFEPHLDGAS